MRSTAIWKNIFLCIFSSSQKYSFAFLGIVVILGWYPVFFGSDFLMELAFILLYFLPSSSQFFVQVSFDSKALPQVIRHLFVRFRRSTEHFQFWSSLRHFPSNQLQLCLGLSLSLRNSSLAIIYWYLRFVNSLPFPEFVWFFFSSLLICCAAMRTLNFIVTKMGVRVAFGTSAAFDVHYIAVLFRLNWVVVDLILGTTARL